MLWHKEQAHMGRVNGVLNLPGGWPVGKQMVNVVEAYHKETGLWPEGWSESACATVVRTNFQGGAYQPSRWSPDKTGHVLAGNAMSTVIHPWLDRTLTHREVARVMGFPDTWRLETYTDKGGNAVYGKGVTVDCGRWIGYWVRRALEGNPGAWQGEPTGEREFTVNVSNDFKRAYNERTGEHGDFRSVALQKEMAGRPA
jgi:site-specific DNA-cytosine methylase